MKKILIFLFVLQIFAVQVFADGFPAFPMSIWGNLKQNWVNIPSGVQLSFYDGQNNLLSSYVTEKNGQYGGTTAFEKAVALNQFSWLLKIKVSVGWNIYTLWAWEIDDSGNSWSWSSCPSKTNLIFSSGVCRYDINLSIIQNVVSNTWTTNTWNVQQPVIHSWKTIMSSWSITSWNSFILSNSNVTINSLSTDTNFITWSLSLSWISNITVSLWVWDWTLIPPTLIQSWAVENATVLKLWNLLPTNSTNTIFQTIKVGWAVWVSLIAWGSNFWVSFIVPSWSAWQVLQLYRSSDWNSWEANSPDSTCTLDSNKICSFYTNHLSFFAPVLSVVLAPVVVSSWWGGGGGWWW